jgi:acyl-CoA thioester hydrolase
MACIIQFMNSFNFYYPLQVRYGDLDPQWHVNNAHFVMFLEQTRFNYLTHTGLFDGKSFFDLGLIVADVHVTYRAPIDMNQEIRVGCRVSRIGNKSLTFEYQIEEVGTGLVFATAETIIVAYDYHTHQSIPVPQDWKDKIAAFEGKEF